MSKVSKLTNPDHEAFGTHLQHCYKAKQHRGKSLTVEKQQTTYLSKFWAWCSRRVVAYWLFKTSSGGTRHSDRKLFCHRSAQTSQQCLLYTPDSPLALGLGPEAFWGWKQKETVSRNGCRVVFEFTNFKTVSPVTASPEAVLRRVLNRQGIRISLILQILTKFYTK